MEIKNRERENRPVSLDLRRARFLAATRLLALSIADKADTDEPSRAEWVEAFGWLWAAAPTEDARVLLLELAAEVIEPAPTELVQ
jgi:hypothetical protein